MIFVIVMEVLNALIKEADRREILTTLPSRSIKHPMSHYADDLMLLLTPKLEDFECIKQVLDLYTGASGLTTNVEKCHMTLIRCSSQVLASLQTVFPCVI
jgi:hypothetical protein